jgi:hypothetical protein
LAPITETVTTQEFLLAGIEVGRVKLTVASLDAATETPVVPPSTLVVRIGRHAPTEAGVVGAIAGAGETTLGGAASTDTVRTFGAVGVAADGATAPTVPAAATAMATPRMDN